MSLFLSRAGAVVQAGAGSGKTHSLVGLCLHLLGGVGRSEPLAPARLCAVTFTEKAAAELQARLRARIDRLALLDDEAALRAAEPELFASCASLGVPPPPRALWERVRRDLDDAAIGTLHRICSRILLRHAAAAGLDPAFAVLEPLEAQLLFAEACERTVLDALEGEGPLRASAERLCAEATLRKGSRFGHGVTDDLRQLAAALGESGRAPAALIAASPGLDPAAAQEGLAQAKRELEEGARELEAALRSAPPRDGTEKARSALARLQGTALPALRAAGEDGLAAVWPQLAEAARALPNRGKTTPLGLAVGAIKDALTALEDAEVAARACVLARDLAALASAALERHAAEKTRLRALEFDDLTRLAGALLERNPSVRRAEKERISALLVDEFQDTSRAQLALCGWLAEERAGEGTAPAGSGLPGARPFEPGLLYLVGDRKQSIYEFRGADVAAAQAFADAAAREGAERHFLRTSYRSLPALVSFSNALFARVLPDAHDPEQPFQAPFIVGEDDLGPARAGGEGPCAELLEAEGDLDAEAAAVARRIAAMLAPGSPERVRERGADGAELARPVRGGDIAILMRSFLPVEALRRALLRARIPHVIVGGRLFHEAREVLDLRALLQLLVDGEDALALAALLRSPFGPVSDEGLALLARAPRADRSGELQPGRGLTRRALENDDLLARLAPDDAEAARRLSSLLERLERAASRLGPAALLEAALAESHYRAAIAGGLFGEQAAANVERLLEMARALELTNARPEGALRALLARLDALEAMGGGESEAAVVEEKSPHAVRLLTIHAAKGLEFPVVLVPLTAMRGPGGPRLVIDPELGLALRLKGLAGNPRWGVAGRRVEDRRLAREEAQSRRLLYVAATRARDRVIFSGRTSEKGESNKSWWTLLREAAGAPALAGLVQPVAARSLPAPLRADASALVNGLGELDALPDGARTSSADAAALPGVDAQLERAIARHAPLDAGTLIAPVTQLANAALCPRRYQLLHELGLEERAGARDEARARRDDDDGEGPPLDAAERGTLAHLLLELLPLEPQLDEPGLRAEAARLLDAEQAPRAAQRELVDAVLAFLSSETGARLRATPERQRLRELPFALHLAPRAGEPAGPRLLVRGQIDLLLLDGGEATVLDYKLTGRQGPDAYALQLGAYALAAHRLIEGSLPVRSGLVFLRAPGAPTALRPPATDEAREETRRALLDAARAIALGRAQSHFAKIEPDGCAAIGCGFLRRCHPAATADAG